MDEGNELVKGQGTTEEAKGRGHATQFKQIIQRVEFLIRYNKVLLAWALWSPIYTIFNFDRQKHLGVFDRPLQSLFVQPFIIRFIS